jgi:hypothetical protein
MPDNAERWAQRLEAALLGGFKLPPMTLTHVLEIDSLMRRTGRYELASTAYRTIPLDKTLPSEASAEAMWRRSLH